MKNKLFICMYSLNIGGAERSLIGLLNELDYKRYEVDLFLYRHEGEFLDLVPEKVNVLPSIKAYTTFERPILQILKEGHFLLASARILAKIIARAKNRNSKNGTYKLMQYMWKFSIPWLPKIEKQYDLGISFLGPHDFIINKVKATIKLGWNHTDYFTIVDPDKKLDEKMWRQLDYIVNVSEECRSSFLKVFPKLDKKTIVFENILSPSVIIEQSLEDVHGEMPDDGHFKICSVGRLCEAKGFDLAVLACRKLIDLGYKIKWYIVGFGQDYKSLKQLIEYHDLGDHFILLGKKTNPYPYIKNCDVYCQPSRYEGKAVTVREAQILEKPVLITDFPTSKSQLTDQFDGVICELSVDGVVNGLANLIRNPQLLNKLKANCLKNDYSNLGELTILDQFLGEGIRQKQVI